MEGSVDQIIKFIEGFFKPIKVKTTEIELGNVKEKIIGVYFDEIPDEYISNSDPGNVKEHKEDMLEREIRKYIENYLGIKTSGLQSPTYLPPPERHGITIVVTSLK